MMIALVVTHLNATSKDNVFVRGDTVTTHGMTYALQVRVCKVGPYQEDEGFRRYPCSAVQCSVEVFLHRHLFIRYMLHTSVTSSLLNHMVLLTLLV